MNHLDALIFLFFFLKIHISILNVVNLLTPLNRIKPLHITTLTLKYIVLILNSIDFFFKLNFTRLCLQLFYAFTFDINVIKYEI